MTQHGQWYDFTTPTGPCNVGSTHTLAGCGQPKTHIVKWREAGPEGRLRHHTCAVHARRIVNYQTLIGAVVRTYRYRKG